MKKEEFVRLAISMGFSNAVLLKTEEIPFEPAFRVCCEDNSCGKYGVNWSCPPDCGTTDQMRDKVRARQYGLVLQTTWDIDSEDGPSIKRCKGQHNKMTRELIAQVQDGTQGFMIGASGCSLCDTCTIVEGKPCRFPDKMASCMSAYCIYVRQLAETHGMEYDSGPGLVNFFGMYVFDEV